MNISLYLHELWLWYLEFFIYLSPLCSVAFRYKVQLREYQKELEYRLHHQILMSVFLNLKPISYFLAFYLETIGVGQHLRKSHFNFGGKFEFRSQSCLAVRSGKKSPNQETGLGNRGCLKVLNDIKLVLNDHELPLE